MKQVSHPPILGIVDNKKWCPFLDLGVRRPIFLHPKTAIHSDLGGKKLGLRTPESKKGHHFLSSTMPKKGGWDTFIWISFSGEFWSNFENREFLAHFWPTSHYNTPKSKPYGALGQLLRWKSDFLYIVSLDTERARFKWVGHKNEFCFLRSTLAGGAPKLTNIRYDATSIHQMRTRGNFYSPIEEWDFSSA